MRLLRSLALAPCFVLFGLACDSFEGTPVAPDGGAGDGGPTGDAASGCATLYVDGESGLDANSGCSPTQAKRTISSALAAAKERKAEVQEVHVCKGDYREADLTLDQRVSLRGGYACSDFTREQNFGAAGAWKFANPTNIYNSKAAVGGAALTVTGTDVGNSIEIDGLLLRSAVESANLSIALAVDNASPFVHDCVLVAAGTTGGGGVVGARLTGTSARLAKNRIDVVGGGEEDVGGIGVIASAGGTVTLDLNAIDVHGGRGKLSGAAGVYASSVIMKATDNFVLVSGEPTTKAGPYTQSSGISVSNGAGSALLGNNVVAAGTGCTASIDCIVSGIAVVSSRGVEVRRNRIMAAALPGGATTNTLMGVSFSLSDQGSIVDNAIVDDASASTATMCSRTGLVIQSSPNAQAVGNTIVFTQGTRGSRDFTEANAGVLVFGGPLSTDPQSGGFKFHRNLVAMLDEDVNPERRVEFGVEVANCSNNGFAPPPKNNVIVGFSTPPTSTRAPYAVTTGCSLTSTVNGNTTLPGDGAERYTCPTAAGVSAAKCVENLFQPLDRKDWAATLLSDKLKLATTAPCVLAKGGGSVVPELGFDLLGKTRAQPFTPGAYERDGCAPPDP